MLANAHEFKLKGNAFCDYTSLQEAINLRKLCCQLLFRLYNLGCKLIISSNLAQKTDLTTWIFHKEQTQQPQFHFAAIGVSSIDKLQFVDFPASMHQMFRDVVQRNWPKTIKNVLAIGDALEIKLSGNPWMSEGGFENVQSKMLIKALINELDAQRWVLYGSSNLKGTADTLFFRYDPNLQMDGSRRPIFAMCFRGDDRLRLVDSPGDVVNCIKTMLIQFWEGGIQAENSHFCSYEFKLAGYPWWSDGTEAIYPRLLMCKIFEALMRIGWRVQMAIDLSRVVDDKSVITFQAGPQVAAPIFCLSLSYTDRIRIINAPVAVEQAISNEIRRVWLFGIKCEQANGPSMELQLKGNPWSNSYDGHDGAHGRVLMLHLLKLCASLGWFVIVSANVSAKYRKNKRDISSSKYPLDVHSWWFIGLGRQAIAPLQTQALHNNQRKI